MQVPAEAGTYSRVTTVIGIVDDRHLVVLMPELGSDAAHAAGELFLGAIDRNGVSVGLAACPGDACTPDALLYHFESQSRGYEDTPGKRARFHNEVAMFHERWRSFLKKGDPYYNPNLSQLAEDCRLGSPFDGLTQKFPF